MQQERIIEGIEKVFEGYAKDKELREAIKGSHQYLLLFGQGRVAYYLTSDRTVLEMRGQGYCFSSLWDVAQDFFKCNRPNTLTKAKMMLEADLGARVEVLKKGYARHFDSECDRQAENRYVQHPEA